MINVTGRNEAIVVEFKKKKIEGHFYHLFPGVSIIRFLAINKNGAWVMFWILYPSCHLQHLRSQLLDVFII